MITFRTLGKLGRFGNQLFQYAGTRLYAERSGYSSAFPNWIGASIFQDIRPYTAIEHLRSRLLPTVQLSDMRSISAIHQAQRVIRLWCQRDMRELYAHPSDNIDLYGYLQDPYSLELLANHKHTVRSWFRWVPDIDSAFRQEAKRHGPWVAVHIRRGDFVRLGATFPLEEILAITEKVRGTLPVYVATDDPVIREKLRGTSLDVTNPLPHLQAHSSGDLFDFWMLQHASTVVGCGSTFAWWAAYLGGKNSYYSPPLTHTWIKGQQPIITKQNL